MEKLNKVLVIPDVHGRTFWKDAVEKHYDEVDKVIFLGDFHDPYEFEGITKKMSMDNFHEVIDWIKEHKEKTIMLIGNHDCQYIFPTFDTRSRLDKKNMRDIYNMFNRLYGTWKLAYECQIGDKPYMFSHAGLTKSWCHLERDIIGELTVENLNKLVETHRGIAALTDLSKYRSFFGGDKTGSIVWSDYREREEDEKENFGEWYQVFGHTRQEEEEPVITDKWACLDCRLAFIIDEEGIKKA